MSLDPEGNSSVNLCLLDTNRWLSGMVRICIRIIKKPKYGVQHNTPLKCVCFLNYCKEKCLMIVHASRNV